jgi:hypothetical protein
MLALGSQLPALVVVARQLQMEVVGGAPGGAIVAVEPAQAREAWASILESKRWLDIQAGYGQDPSGFIVRLQTNVEGIRPNKIVFWMKALVPPGEPNGEPELRDVILCHAGEHPDVTWWIASLSQQDETWIIWMFQLDALRAWEENNLSAYPGITVYHLGAKAAVDSMLVKAIVGVGRHSGELGISVGLADEPSPFLSAALVVDSGLGWRMRVNASAEAQAAVMLSRDGEDPSAPVLSVAIGW